MSGTHFLDLSQEDFTHAGGHPNLVEVVVQEDEQPSTSVEGDVGDIWHVAAVLDGPRTANVAQEAAFEADLFGVALSDSEDVAAATLHE